MLADSLALSLPSHQTARSLKSFVSQDRERFLACSASLNLRCIDGRPGLPLSVTSDSVTNRRKAPVRQLLYELFQEYVECGSFANDELNNEVQWVRTLGFCEQFASVSFRLFKYRHLEHNSPSEL